MPLVVYGDGSQTRDFVNVHDVVDAVLASMKKREAEGEVFNIGSGKPTSINELAKTVLGLSGINTAISYEPPRVGDIKNSYADISRAQKLSGYQPKFSLTKGLSGLFAEKTFAAIK